MTRFEPRIFGVGSDRSTNYATAAACIFLFFESLQSMFDPSSFIDVDRDLTSLDLNDK